MLFYINPTQGFWNKPLISVATDFETKFPDFP